MVDDTPGKQDADNSDDVNIVSVAFTWADDDPESVSTKSIMFSMKRIVFGINPSRFCADVG